MEIELLSLYSGTIKEIYVKEGDRILKNQSFALISTVENGYQSIASEYEGYLVKVFVDEGEKIVEGMVLAIIRVS